MKKSTLFLGIFLISVSGVCQPLNRTFQYYESLIYLLGPATYERLKEDPFGEWFNANYQEYEVDSTVREISMPDSITIFMGTWCGDSRREVPRFIKILEQTDFDLSKLKIIGLNAGFQNYKQAPEREEAGMDIHRVPTMILQNSDGLEIGRIVEEPVISLEEDLKIIMNETEYRTAYPVAQDLIKKFKPIQ